MSRSKLRAKPAAPAAPKLIEFILDDLDVQYMAFALGERGDAIRRADAQFKERLAPMFKKYGVPDGVVPNFALNDAPVPSAISWDQP